MKNKKSTFVVAFLTIMVCVFVSKPSFAQTNKFIGKWVITPEMSGSIISHITISKKGNGFEVSRTKVPEEKWSALFDAKNQKMVAILDGKMVYFTYNLENDRLLVFDWDTNKKLFELKRE